MILAWLLLLTGLTISAVAIYYSVVGLAAIFSAAVIPIIVMGSALEVAKLVCASWLKANWTRAPALMKIYMTIAVIVLMFITSMGIFGFLSKAHSDQSLVSGDVQSKISVYDEKIKTAKDNIDANRKALKQMDEAVDQVMGRSQDEKGADKAVAIRRGQQKERARLQSEITAEQKIISQLSEERAPIAAEVRKVEAEVGPLKYIASFIYGDNPDSNLLEKAVTWVIITIIIVFDPLAVIMLLAAQMTFGWRKQPSISDFVPQPTELVVETPPTKTESTLNTEQTHTEVPSETPLTALGGDITAPEEPVVPGTTESELDKWNRMVEEAEKEVARAREETSMQDRLATGETYINAEGDEVKLGSSGPVFPEDPKEGDTHTRTDFDPEREFTFNGSQWVESSTYTTSNFPEADLPIDSESKKKTYMIKDPKGSTQIKTR